jgi:hypothetical protein
MGYRLAPRVPGILLDIYNHIPLAALDAEPRPKTKMGIGTERKHRTTHGIQTGRLPSSVA